jgi:hypothetical protein
LLISLTQRAEMDVADRDPRDGPFWPYTPFPRI